MKIVMNEPPGVSIWRSGIIIDLTRFCVSDDLRRLSCCSSELNTGIVNAAVVRFSEVFDVDPADASCHFPSSRYSLLKLLDYVHMSIKSHQFADVAHFACAAGYSSFLSRVIRSCKPAEVVELMSTYTKDGSPPIVLASRNGHANIVRLLIEAKCSPDRPDLAGRTALWHASRGHHASVVALLVNEASKVDSLCESLSACLSSLSNLTPPTVASMSECLEAISSKLFTILLQLSSNTRDIQDEENRTISCQVVSTIICCMNTIAALGNPHSSQLLLTILPTHTSPRLPEFIRGIWTTCLSRTTDSPLVIASYTGNHYAIPSLVASGICMVSDCGLNSKLPLIVAAENGHARVVRHLLESNALISHTTSTGRNCLHVAVERDHAHVVEVVCQFATAADITHRNQSGITPLVLAENKGRLNILLCMLECYSRSVSLSSVDATANKLIIKYQKALTIRRSRKHPPV